MQIDIQSRSYQVTGSLLEHVVQRVRHLLSHARDHIRNVRVQLVDIDRPDGSAASHDRRCVVQVKLYRSPMVVTEETQADLQGAVDRALDRAGRAVKRRLERPRERRRGAQSHLAQMPLVQWQLNARSRSVHHHSIH